MDQLRPSDDSWLCRPVADRAQLCDVQTEPGLVNRRNRILGLELARRQPGRNAGSIPRQAASEIRVLFGPHSGQHRLRSADGRIGAFRIHESRDSYQLTRPVPSALDSVLPGDLYAGRVPHVVLELWADRTAGALGDWQPGCVALADGPARPQAV